MKKRLLSYVLSCLALAIGLLSPTVLRADELTVNDGATGTNSYLPVYGMYVDTYGSHQQTMYLASELEDIGVGGTISSLTFYLSSSAEEEWNAKLSVKLEETTASSLSSSFVELTNPIEVYNGTSLSGTGTQMVVNFTTPYTYNGGNLVIDFLVVSAGSWQSASFYGDSSKSGMGRYNSGSGSGTAQNFQPKVTFTYVPGGTVTCPKPKALAVSNIGNTGADLSWTAGGEETQWAVVLKSGDSVVDSTVVNSPSKQLTGLSEKTNYSVYVRAICGAEDISKASSTVSFKTTGVATALPFSTGFEDDADNTKWDIVNGSATNNWVIGSATNNGGSKALYVSKDAGTSNEYNIGSASFVWAYRLFNFSEAGDYSISFDWHGVGESTFDGMAIFLMPATFEPVAASSSSVSFGGLGFAATYSAITPSVTTAAAKGVFALKASADATYSWFNQQSSWLEGQACSVSITTPGAYILCFGWVNDGSKGTSPAGAIDNLSIKKKTCPDVNGLHFVSSTLNTATFAWSNNGTAEFALKVLNGADTLVNTTVSDTAYTITSLEPNSHYNLVVLLRGICGEDDESDLYRAPLSFDTECELVEISGDTLRYDFENAIVNNDPFTQPCWRNWVVGDDEAAGHWRRYTSYVHSGSYALYLNAYSTRQDAIALPLISIPEGFEVQFYARKSSASYSDSLFVYYNSTAQSLEGAVSLDTIVLNAAYGDSPYRYKLPRSSEGLYVIFVGHGGSSYGYIAIDDVSFNEAPQCTPVSNIVIGEVTTNSATFSWTPGGNESAWAVTVDGGDEFAEEPSFTMEGLEPNTDYEIEVSVVADCGDEIMSEPLFKTLSFKTSCEAISVDSYEEGFESYAGTTYSSNGVAPDCWDVYSTGTILPHVINSGSYYYVHTGEKALTFYGSGNCYAAMPLFDEPLNTLQLGFWYRMESTTYGTLTLGYIKANDVEMNTFTPFATITNATVMTYSEHSLAALPDDAYRLVFRWYYSSQYSCCIDDVTLSRLPSCQTPYGVDVVASTTEAVFSWVGNADNYYFMLAHGTDTVFNDTIHGASSYTLTGLTPATSYSNYRLTVVGLCSDVDHSDTVRSTLSFTTDCEAITIFPWSEDFESYTSGAFRSTCWGNEHIAGSSTGLWQIPSSGGPSYSPTGGKGVYVSYQNTGNKLVLATPLLDIPEAGGYEVRFWFYRNSYYSSYPNEKLQVWVNNNVADTVGAVKLGSINHGNEGSPEESASGWYQYSYVIPEAGVQRIVFEAFFANGYSFYLDDIEVRKLPSCVGATSLVAVDSLATLNSVRLAWTSDASSFKVHYECTNDSALKADVVVDEPALTISGLTSGTAYAFNVSVVAVCSAEDEATDTLKAAVVATTLCERVSVLPWRQNFDALTSGIPTCWDNSEGTTTTESYRWNYFATGYNGAGLRFNSYSNTSDYTNILATPEIILPEEPAQLVFYCKNPTGGNFSVQVSANGGARATLLSGLTGILDWTEKVVNLTDYAGDTVVFYFNATSNYGSGDAYLYLDDIRVRNIPTCETTAAVFAIDSLATQNSVTFAWNKVSDDAQYRVVVKNGGNEIATTAAWPDTVYTITDLSASMTYNFAIDVYTLCEGDQVSEAKEVTLKMATLCGPVTLPFKEDFENSAYGSGILPQCWTYPFAGVSYYPYVYNYGAYEGSKFLYFYGGGSSVRMAVMPEMAEDLTGKRLRFYYHSSVSSSSYNYGNIIVGVMSAPADTATFTALAIMPQTNNYEEAEIMLTGAPAGSRYIAFKYAGGTSSYGYAYIDNIIVDEAPACTRPADVVISDMSTHSVTFSWTGSAPQYEAVVRINGDSVATVTVDAAALTIDTLRANTQYSVALELRSLCGGEDGNSDVRNASFSFRTDCEAISTLPWSEGFEDMATGNSYSSAPLCWNILNANKSGSRPYVYVSTSYKNSGSKSLFLETETSGAGFAILPPFTDLTNAEISFYYKNENASSGGQLVVGYITDITDSTTFVPLMAMVRSASWTESVSVPLVDVPVGARVALKLNRSSSSYYYVYVDDITVREIPTCVKPMAVTTGVITTTTAEISWEGGNADSYQLLAVGSDSVSIDTIVSGNSFTLTGLEPAHTYVYAVAVTGLCSEEDHSDALIATLNITTECEAITTLPWSEGFEGMATGSSTSAAPLCWALINANDGTYPYIYVNTSSSYVKTGSKSLYFQSSGSRYGYAVLPAIDADLSNMEIEFDFKSENASSSGYLYLGYMTSLDESSFVQIEAYDRSTEWQHGETPLTAVPAGARIAFKYGGASNNYYLGIDDISIHSMPNCHKPSNITVDYTANEADFAWEGNSDSYNLVISSAADTLVDTVVVAAEYALAVEPETYYNLTVFVQGICPAESDTLSEPSSKTFRFTTPASCPVVTNIEKVAVTENEADFSWDFGGDENEWYVRVIQTNVTPADTLFKNNVSNNMVNIVALQPNTAYSMRVEVVALCSADDSSHVASAYFTFTTPMPAAYTQVLTQDEEFAPDFDDAEERQKWGFVNGTAVNHFVFGTDANALVGEAQYGLYVTNNDNTAAYAYTTSNSSGSAVYRNIRVNLDSAVVEYSFSWMANGESNYDYGRALIVPAEADVVAGSSLMIGTTTVAPGSSYYTNVPANSVGLADNTLTSPLKLNGISAFQEVTGTVVIPASGDYKLLFVWGNDNTTGTQYPLAVGGISLKLTGGVNPETGIDNINAEGSAATKFIRNGHVFIKIGEHVYDAVGRKVTLE